MLPYFSFTSFSLGPLTVQVWGLMVALGILAGYAYMVRLGKRLGVETRGFESAAFWVVFFSFVGARVGHFLFYAPWSEIGGFFRIWEPGWSSFGGIAGGALAFILMRKKLFAGLSFGRAADLAVCGLPLGMAVGRIGCFLIHDHPGTLSHFLLAVNFPGGARHDLGLYESIAMFILAGVIAWKSEWLLAKEGRLARVVGVTYALFRFPMDFLRAVDARYLGLTPAQYACLIMLAAIAYASRRKNV